MAGRRRFVPCRRKSSRFRMSIGAEISEFETSRNIVDAIFGDAIPEQAPIAKNVRQSNPEPSVMSVADGCSARPEIKSAN